MAGQLRSHTRQGIGLYRRHQFQRHHPRLPARRQDTMTILLGCIADDFTGATDLASMLVQAGMRTVQTIGIPKDGVPADTDAVVRSEEHTSELQSLMRISYAVFCLKKKNHVSSTPNQHYKSQ